MMQRLRVLLVLSLLLSVVPPTSLVVASATSPNEASFGPDNASVPQSDALASQSNFTQIVTDTASIDLTQVPEEMHGAFLELLRNKPAFLLAGQHFAVIAIRLEKDWALATLANLDGDPESVGMGDYGAAVIARKNHNKWEAALEGTLEFNTLVLVAPDNFLSSEAKQIYRAQFSPGPQAPQYANMKFPWDQTQSWKLTQGWHSGNAVDFAPAGSEANKWALAATEGVVTRICPNTSPVQATVNIRIQNTDGTTTEYLHIDKSTVTESMLGTSVSQGAILGKLYGGTYGGGWYNYKNNYKSCLQGTPNCNYYRYKDNCGIGTGPHLHFILPSQSVTIDGWSTGSDNVWHSGTSTKHVGDWFGSSNARVDSIDLVPVVSFNQANTTAITARGQTVESNNPNWTFSGTASDDKGVARVEYNAWGNNGNVTQNASGTISWSHTINGLLGHNQIRFFAYDTINQRNSDSDRYYIDLYVDTASPTTGYNLVGTPGENGWYRSAVQVSLAAQDNGSGSDPNQFRAGVTSLAYRVDGGSWQTIPGAQGTFNVSGDGTHTVEYRATDRVGNAETTQTLTLKIDATPPPAPSTITETHGALSGQWQSQISDSAFVWSPSTDAQSGVRYYRIDWNGTLQVNTNPSYDPVAVRTGSYALQVRAVDGAGNLSPASAAFTFRYDGTPPHTPAIQNLDGVASGMCQSQVRTPNFNWPTPIDDGSGVQGYYRYWGSDPNGTGGVLTTANVFSSATPIAAADSAATYYLRLRSEDGVGLQSDWVAFALRYDGAPPTATLVANYGLPTVNQTNVHLALNANDLGCGVTKMRLSNGGAIWTVWQDYAPELYWEIPSLGRRSHDILLQIQDAAGNVSGIVSDTVLFDVNSALPKSENFHLWDQLVSAGSNIVTSTQHTLRSTVGQPWDSPLLSSVQYLLQVGFQAGALAAPEAVPTSTTYSQIGSLFASATTSATAISSMSYRLYGSMGQPSHMQTITSPQYVATLGFWGGAGRTSASTAPPTTTIPPPTFACNFYSLSVNDGALFTNSPNVSLTVCGPDAANVLLSNDGGFGGAAWQPYTTTMPWILTTYGATVLPRFVYARYQDGAGSIHGTFFDDIIYDPTAPNGQASFDPANFLPGTRQPDRPAPLRVVTTHSADLYLSASDDSSGLAQIQIGEDPTFAGATWQPYSAIVPFGFSAGDGVKTVYARFRDQVGNVSSASHDALIIDTTPPTGTAHVIDGVVGPGALQITLTLTATDAVGTVSEVRVSSNAAFTDTVWRPYQASLPINVDFTGELTPTVYAQFRDAAGNESAIVTATYQVDVNAPSGEVTATDWNGITATITLSATDDLSGVAWVWLSPDYWFFSQPVRVPYQPTLEWNFGDTAEVYVRFEDGAGNVSEPYWVPAQLEPATDEYAVYLPLILR